MTMRSWGWVGMLAWWVGACGGHAESNAPAAAGQTSSGHDDNSSSAAPNTAGSMPIVISNPTSASAGGESSLSVGGGGSTIEAAGTGGDGGADTASELDYVSKLLGTECPRDLCAGTVAASDCKALPNGVVRTAEAACGGNEGNKFDRMRTLTFEFSATRRKACYYAEADYEAPARLVGAEVWDDKPVSHVRAGSYPDPDCRFPTAPSTLCDLEDPTQDPPRDPNVPARGCFDAFSGTCEPCCDDANDKHPDCTDQADGYPGFACTPHPDHGMVSYCSCSCYGQQWDCEC